MIVEIVNYKTIKHLKFEFEGFASIVGPNFYGKSAIAGAIVSALTNSMDKTSVRYDETFSEVTIIRGDLHVFWHYEEGNTYYIINGQEYKKLNGAIPPPLVEAGFAPITIADEKEYLWYIEQFNPLFVVNRDRSNFSTDLLATIFKFDAVYKALDLCKKEIRENNSLVKLLDTDLLTARDELAPALPLEAILPNTKGIVELSNMVRELGEHLESMEEWSSRLKDGQKVLLALRPIKNLPEVPGVEEGEALLAELRTLDTLVASLRRSSLEYKALLPTKSLPECPSTDTANSLLKELEKVSTLAKRLTGAQEALAVLSAVPGIPEAPSLDEVAVMLEDLAKVSTLNNSLQTCGRALARVKPVKGIPSSPLEELAVAEALLKDLQVINDLHSRVMGASREQLTAKRLLAEAEDEFTGLIDQLSEFKSCPTCGQGLPHPLGETHE